MNQQIEELRKFSKTTINKARLDSFRVALSNASTLFYSLEAKPGDDDAAAEFESTQSELESSLSDLESACDDLESAEDKDERQDAQDQITDALEETIKHFDGIMPVAVIGDPANAKVAADFKAELVALASVPKEKWSEHMLEWMKSAATAEDKRKRAEYISKLLNKKPKTT